LLLLSDCGDRPNLAVAAGTEKTENLFREVRVSCSLRAVFASGAKEQEHR